MHIFLKLLSPSIIIQNSVIKDSIRIKFPPPPQQKILDETLRYVDVHRFLDFTEESSNMNSKLVLIILLLVCNRSEAGDMLMELSGSGVSGFGLSSGEKPLDNVTLTCAERNIMTSGESQLSTALIRTVDGIRMVYFSSMFLLGILLNSFVIWLVATHKKLHTLSFGVALQVIMLDILLCVSIYLPIVITSIARRWVLGKDGCVLTAFINFFAGLQRTFLMFVFVVDRFLSVYFPYFYPRHKVKITVSLSVFSWLIVFILSVIGIPGIFDCYTLNSNLNYCTRSSTCSRTCFIIGNTSFATLGVPSTVVPLFLFGALYCKGRRIRKEMAAPDGGGCDEAGKKEWRATITFFLLFITLFALTIPNTTVQIIIAQVAVRAGVPSAVFVIQVLSSGIISLLVLTDPIVIMRNKDVREILKTIFICKFCTKSLANAPSLN